MVYHYRKVGNVPVFVIFTRSARLPSPLIQRAISAREALSLFMAATAFGKPTVEKQDGQFIELPQLLEMAEAGRKAARTGPGGGTGA